MSKRPHQSGNTGGFNKKPKQDFDDVKRPGEGGTSNVLKNQNNVNQYQNRFKQNLPSTSNFRSSNVKPVVVRAPPVSIADKDNLMDSDDDDILIIASQQGEEEERRMNERRQQMSEEINMTIDNFTQFLPKKQPTSTQMILRSDPPKNIIPEKNEVFTGFAVPKASQLGLSTQKENITLTQMLGTEKNKTQALEIRLRLQQQDIAKLHEKIKKKEGENSNLRREKKLFEEKNRLSNIQNAQKVPDEDEKDKKIKSLEAKLMFQLKTQSSNKPVLRESVQKAQRSSIPFINFSHQSKSRAPQVSTKVFDMEEKMFDVSLDKNRTDHGTSEDVVRIQLRLAQVNAMLLAGGHLEHALLDNLFQDSAQMINHICKYIDYIEVIDVDEICYDSNPGLTVCAMISVPLLREKLTTFDPIENILDKSRGFPSIFQAEKMFQEELCSKPRRIIACISTLARSSRAFSEKLLLENISIADDDYQTFVSKLVSKLEKISESKKVYDYWGLAIASASLLASLGSHFKHFNHSIVDDILLIFLQKILRCRCDNPVMMKYVSEFLAYVTNDGNSSEMISSVCRLFPREDIISSNTYKYSLYPENACIFQMFTMYLLTSFNFDGEMNQYEFELLLETALNLNKIALNIQGVNSETLKFLNWDETTQTSKICSCFSMLVNSLIFLNHQVLHYRNFNFKTFVQSESQTKEQKPDQYYAARNEVARSFTIALANLFDCIDSFTDFPIENLVFSNRLEQICSIIKQGRYNTELYASSFETINIVPNILRIEEDEAMEDSDSDNDHLFINDLRISNASAFLDDAV